MGGCGIGTTPRGGADSTDVHRSGPLPRRRAAAAEKLPGSTFRVLGFGSVGPPDGGGV